MVNVLPFLKSAEEIFRVFFFSSSVEACNKVFLSRHIFQLSCVKADVPIQIKRNAKKIFILKTNQFRCRHLFVNCKNGSEHGKVYYWFWPRYRYYRNCDLFLS